MAIASEIASKSPMAVWGTKQTMHYTRDHTVADGLEFIANWNAAMFDTDDMAEAFKASIEKRPAEFPDLEPRRHSISLPTISTKLRDDVRSVVDVGGAISAVTRWAIGAAAVAAIVSWIIFQSRIDSGAIAIIFALVAGVCAIPLGAAVGGWLLARRRLNIVTEASGRVVDVVGQMHGDVLQLRAGTAETSVQQVAVSLLQEAVFPAVFGTGQLDRRGSAGAAQLHRWPCDQGANESRRALGRCRDRSTSRPSDRRTRRRGCRRTPRRRRRTWGQRPLRAGPGRPDIDRCQGEPHLADCCAHLADGGVHAAHHLAAHRLGRQLTSASCPPVSC
ncbi:Delta(3,5)-Delta(2,4)-dienoyl-CoA isomerase, mitochondrial [Nymphon striatum]|nr:Delta(3,5)-Delta(2,4)-dienoyl-CoA isomerase, mitochondrial [Nymphon striatum]